MSTNNVIDVTQDTFKSVVIESDKPVIVDFWAEWCGPCKKLSPIIEDIAAEMGDQITVAKVDVDHNPQTAQKFTVMSIPTFLFFKDGKVIDSMIGATTKDEFKKHIDKVIA